MMIKYIIPIIITLLGIAIMFDGFSGKEITPLEYQINSIHGMIFFIYAVVLSKWLD